MANKPVITVLNLELANIEHHQHHVIEEVAAHEPSE